MRKRISDQQPIPEDDDIEAKVAAADPVVKLAFAELLKENDRLQKLRVKDEIRHKSEKNYLNAKIAELEKNKITVVIERTHGESPENNRNDFG